MLKIVCILAHSRSGSTILDIALGQHPDILSAGELRNFYRYGHIEQQFCSCGKKVITCDFWKNVSSTFFEILGSKNVPQLERNLSYFERRRYLPMTPYLANSQHWMSYKNQLLSLYKALSITSNKKVIVDSSKNPLRYFWLSQLAKEKEIELYPIFLIRDGRGVIWSHKKAINKNPKKGVQMEFLKTNTTHTTGSWLWVNIESDLVSLVGCNKAQSALRYEDLCESFSDSISKLFNTLKMDPAPVINCYDSHKPLSTYHLISGNRLRMTPELKFQPDLEWIQKLPKREKNLFWFLAGWYAAKKGYTRVA